jgi:hypothetical protein
MQQCLAGPNETGNLYCEQKLGVYGKIPNRKREVDSKHRERVVRSRSSLEWTDW